MFRSSFNQLKQNWNFNRLFLSLNGQLFWVDGRPDAKNLVSLDRSRTISSRLYRRCSIPYISPSGFQALDVLVVAQHGRFGNMVRQVALAIATAKKLGIGEVIVKSLPLFPQGTWSIDGFTSLTHDSKLRTRTVRKPLLALGGDFFVRSRLPVDLENSEFEEIGSFLSRLGGFSAQPPLDPETLVIHIRSGDVFTNKPHSSLGQPPLSFYQYVIREEKPSKIVLVFEDYANPVIGRLISHVSGLNIPFDVSSGDFRTDVSVLLSARKLVTSVGTLADAILLLSPNIERWISFGRPARRYYQGRALQSIKSVFDESGEYSGFVLNENWKNSAAQRDMMLNFPLRELRSV